MNTKQKRAGTNLMLTKYLGRYLVLLRALQKIQAELKGIEDSDLTRAERNILGLVKQAIVSVDR